MTWQRILGDLFQFETWKLAFRGLRCWQRFELMCDYISFVERVRSVPPHVFRRIWDRRREGRRLTGCGLLMENRTLRTAQNVAFSFVEV